MSDKSTFNRQEKTYLWQLNDFPHFYHNPVAVAPLEKEFTKAFRKLIKAFPLRNQDFDDLFTEEIIANSKIEGIKLDRDSVHSSFVNNIVPTQEKEQGAVELMKMSLDHCDKDLSHQRIKSMHKVILKGSSFPDSSIGNYVGDMKIISGNELYDDYEIIHEGAPKELVTKKMAEFIKWFNQCKPNSPLTNAIQGHIHFETLHPFCDGNGRIGRSIILMGLCRDFKIKSPLAISRALEKNIDDYYSLFRSGLDLTDIIKKLQPIFIQAIDETYHILSTTSIRHKVYHLENDLHPRQLKVMNRLIDYELKDGFQGGLTNSKYQKMAKVSDRTALRDLEGLTKLKLLTKQGDKKATRYYLR
jgi:Fic family protein